MAYYIALDVGGTEIKACIVSDMGEIISKIEKFKAYSRGDKEEVIQNFMNILHHMEQEAKQEDRIVSGIGMAFPGPFDYENGISLMKDINKYDAIYGINLKTVIQERLGKAIPIAFKNDADLFTLGEALYGQGRNYKKGMCICIGTGLGSGFYEDKALVVSGERVPVNGWIYGMTYKDGIADQYLSASGLQNSIKDNKNFPDTLDVKGLANLAKEGNIEAVEIFSTFGKGLASVVVPYVIKFQAECLVVGGQVAKSFDLFKDALEEQLKPYNVEILVSPESTERALSAISTLFV